MSEALKTLEPLRRVTTLRLLDRMIAMAEEISCLTDQVKTHSHSSRALMALLGTLEEVALTLEDNFNKDIAHNEVSGILAQDANEVHSEDMDT